jgi:type IV secretory pathway TrbD component
VEFVAARLQEHPDYHGGTLRSPSRLSGVTASDVAFGITLSLIGLALWVVLSARKSTGNARRADERRSRAERED